MSTFMVEIVSEGDMATIYSIKQDGHKMNEFEKFIEGRDRGSRLLESYQFLSDLVVRKFVDDYGIDQRFFRHEGFVSGLPPSPNVGKRDREFLMEVNCFLPGFPLRLFCYPVSDKILIVFNGGVKQTATTQEDPKLEMKRKEAESFAKRLNAALRQGILEYSWDGLHLEDDGSQDEILIY